MLTLYNVLWATEFISPNEPFQVMFDKVIVDSTGDPSFAGCMWVSENTNA